MEKDQKIAGAVCIASALGALFVKNKTAKMSLFGLSATAGSYFLYKEGKRTFLQVKKECAETQTILENSKINTEELSTISNSLTDQTEKDPESGESYNVPFGATLYKQCRGSLEDNWMEIHGEKYIDVLHIGQRGKKLLIAIPLPKTGRKTIGLTSKDVYLYFKEELTAMISNGDPDEYEDGLPLGLEDFSIYQKGYEVRDEEGIYRYHEINKDGQDTKDYLDTLSKIHYAWENNKSFKDEKMREGVVRYEQYLLCEIPTSKKDAILKGIDITGALLLINNLMDTRFEIQHQNGTADFEFNEVRFHPSDDFSEVYNYDQEDHVLDVLYL